MSSIRFHPYSQTKPSSTTANTASSIPTTTTTTGKQQHPLHLNKPTPKNANIENKKPIFHNQFNPNISKKPTLDSNYELQTYLNDPKPRIVYPTMRNSTNETFKGILKNLNNDSSRSSKLIDGHKWTKVTKNKASDSNDAESNKLDPNTLKFFTGTTKSIKFYANKVNNEKRDILGAHLFEITAQLDSAISENGDLKEFTIKDQLDRMPCVFAEIDRQMEKFVRGCYLRCVGKFEAKKGFFRCVSVRMATQDDLFGFNFHVNQTNSFMKQCFL